MDGSDPAPPSSAGSVMKNADRILPSTIRGKNRCFSSGDATLLSRYILPSSGAQVWQANGPSGDKPERISTAAVSLWVRCPPSSKICGVITSAERASAFISSPSSSDGPCDPHRGSPSKGMTVSRTKASTRSAISNARGEIPLRSSLLFMSMASFVCKLSSFAASLNILNDWKTSKVSKPQVGLELLFQYFTVRITRQQRIHYRIAFRTLVIG